MALATLRLRRVAESHSLSHPQADQLGRII